MVKKKENRELLIHKKNKFFICVSYSLSNTWFKKNYCKSNWFFGDFFFIRVCFKMIFLHDRKSTEKKHLFKKNIWNKKQPYKIWIWSCIWKKKSNKIIGQIHCIDNIQFENQKGNSNIYYHQHQNHHQHLFQPKHLIIHFVNISSGFEDSLPEFAFSFIFNGSFLFSV